MRKRPGGHRASGRIGDSIGDDGVLRPSFGGKKRRGLRKHEAPQG
ncbi:hypothetical protein RSPO_m01104 (plasmid) [Ralstonia solanacearum Po82]|uniref:Uncharacterized protein n=1 Tax=Ralstonia solanacearum (strain Po82) TaxID=1031711 RepID=F6G9F1_RALS8|nr:hypothetical protein RSPO_m01104 [Ralstonia solanacearum Po82]